jgi:hypothetical protein
MFNQRIAKWLTIGFFRAAPVWLGLRLNQMHHVPTLQAVRLYAPIYHPDGCRITGGDIDLLYDADLDDMCAAVWPVLKLWSSPPRLPAKPNLVAYQPDRTPRLVVAQNTKRWFELPDSYHRAEACIDENGKILALVSEAFPTMEPGVWYAESPEHSVWGSFVSKLLAKIYVEKRLGGCPNVEPLGSRK